VTTPSRRSDPAALPVAWFPADLELPGAHGQAVTDALTQVPSTRCTAELAIAELVMGAFLLHTLYVLDCTTGRCSTRTSSPHQTLLNPLAVRSREASPPLPTLPGSLCPGGKGPSAPIFGPDDLP
jgi:hypothetical protein